MPSMKPMPDWSPVVGPLYFVADGFLSQTQLVVAALPAAVVSAASLIIFGPYIGGFLAPLVAIIITTRLIQNSAVPVTGDHRGSAWFRRGTTGAAPAEAVDPDTRAAGRKGAGRAFWWLLGVGAVGGVISPIGGFGCVAVTVFAALATPWYRRRLDRAEAGSGGRLAGPVRGRPARSAGLGYYLVNSPAAPASSRP